MSFLGVVLYCIGLGSFFSYPHMAPDTYVSENALGIGGFNFYFSEPELKSGIQFTNQYINKQNTLKEATKERWMQETTEWLQEKLVEMGFEAYGYSFGYNESRCWVVYATVRAPRSDSSGAFLIGAQYEEIYSSNREKDVSAVGLAVSLMGFLRSKNWLSRDYHFVFTPAHLRDVGMNSWLEGYHSNCKDMEDFVRGPIWTGINVQLELPTMSSFSGIYVNPEGAFGQLPNLDVLNTVFRVAYYENVKDIGLNSPEQLPKFFDNFPTEMKTLLNFMKNQAFGTCYGNHAMFAIYGIDGFTMTAKSGPLLNIWKFGRIIEGSTRSFNSILEHLHQSFYFYLLPAPFKYVSIGNYMISLGLMLLGPFLYSTFVLFNSSKTSLVYSFLQSFIAFSGCGAIYAFPFTYHRIYPAVQQQQLLLCWLTFCIFALIAMGISFKRVNYFISSFSDEPRHNQKRTLYALTLGFVICFLAVFSSLNFSFIVLCSSIFLPYTLAVAASGRAGGSLLVLLALGAIGSTLKDLPLHDFINSNLQYGTLLLPFFGFIHLPITLLLLLYLF
uniref:Uncharacterized protein n=1 Tax=Arcella intermedia TaxID=1963864 RepID=A0A6B2L0X5_9EUKA